jgi:hypothetical protein
MSEKRNIHTILKSVLSFISIITCIVIIFHTARHYFVDLPKMKEKINNAQIACENKTNQGQ